MSQYPNIYLHITPLRLQQHHLSSLYSHPTAAFGPRTEPLVMGDTPLDAFKTLEMQQYAVLR